MIRILACFFIMLGSMSCTEEEMDPGSDEGSTAPAESSLWPYYTPEFTEFRIWSPSAAAVQLNLFSEGIGGQALETHPMEAGPGGIWTKRLDGDLHGTYYTYQVMMNNTWLGETPGIYAQAVGVNGKRAMVIDMDRTDPEGWDSDKGPYINYPNEAIIYELHVRDMTIHPESGSSMPGKYLGLVEEGIRGPGGVATGKNHLVEMGITHVHLLPVFDHNSIDEEKLDSAQFNWGYDPENYNVPEGSYSSDPYLGEVRIREFKQMVKAFHDIGIGVIMDVVYNHTAHLEGSNFELEAPGYYYRRWEDGRPSDASGCGNETASEKEMMRRFIIASTTYWAEEYHIDGFRFDLMGIHDIQTMNEVANALKRVNPNIIIYGEGWTAGDSPLPAEERAVKRHISRMPLIAAFSDDIRDGLKGSVFDRQSTGFVSGAENNVETVKFGVVGAIYHPQVNYGAVNYSDTSWASEPWQAVTYVSCHDNHSLYDKLKISRPDADEASIIAMDKLAAAVILTSQGTAFLHAGVEMLRTKNGEHNSYNLPDEINRIDWQRKTDHAAVVDYYRNLIALRKAHPAFRMPFAEDVRANLEFITNENGLVSYRIGNNANGDSWKNIYVIYNARPNPVQYELEGNWQLALIGDTFSLEDGIPAGGKVEVPAISMVVAFQK